MRIYSLQNGFTLFELMITLTISVIMLTLAFPCYLSYETHEKRIGAESALMQLSSHLENYFMDHATYEDATPEKLDIPALEHHLQDYTLQLSSLSETHFVIQAIPQNVQKKHDSECGTLILTDTNERKISGDGDVKKCW